MRAGLALVLALAAVLFCWRLDRPGFSDTEGMYAEPAREMVATGDWVTPRMNGVPFLTKPPLMYWLPAVVMAVRGPTEWARVCPALAALGTLAVVGALGAELGGAGAGLAAAAVLATSAGFFMEARLLRSDMVLVLAVTTALWCYVRLRRGAGRGSALGLWTAIGIGLLDKGFLAIVLPGGAIALAEIAGGELRPRTLGARLRALAAPLGAAIVLATALPWHLLAGARNPGFLWDYVVNQHLLFFFDEKLPRDSIPDTLGFFWAMFVVRGLPWSLLWPAAALHAWRTGGAAVRLPAAWLAVVLALFSCAAGRLEHYAMPAVPPAALLLGLCLADLAGGRTRVATAWLVVPPTLAAIAAAGMALRDPHAFLAGLDPTLLDHGLGSLVRPALGALAVGLGAFAALLARRRAWPALLAGVVTSTALLVCAQLAHERVEALFSWRPFALAIATETPAARVFFRAEDEYQLCGGLDYYLGHPVDLLAPPNWVPPTFLATQTDRLFIPRAALAGAWRDGTAVLVSDAAPLGTEDELAPGPQRTLMRAGDRVLLRPAPR